jgi:hypothetical protein
MKYKVMSIIFALVLVASFAASVSAASDEREDHHGSGVLHVTKECTQYTGLAGGFCTITSSNLEAIRVGSVVYYDQAAGTPTGLLDSNIVLDDMTGNGNRAVGRCILDLATGLGLCTFSDGTGQFAGFNARVDVSPPGPKDGVDWHWEGTYSFNPEPRR